jgi:transposase
MVNKEKSKDILIEKLRDTMRAKNLSPEEASSFLGVSFKTIYRWLAYENSPGPIYRRAISRGIRRMEKIGRT